MAVLQYLHSQHSLMGIILVILLTCNPLMHSSQPMFQLEGLVLQHVKEYSHVWSATVSTVYCQEFGDSICCATVVVQGIAASLQSHATLVSTARAAESMSALSRLIL
jgi:hypothetical protein